MLNLATKGYDVRPAQLADVEAVCALCNAWSMRMQGVATHDPDEQRVDWQIPGFDLDSDTRVVFDPGGTLAAFAMVWDVREPHVWPHGFVRVHPDFDDPDLNEQLLLWTETRAKRAVDRAPTGARVILTHDALDQDEDGKHRLIQHGYRVVRVFARLRIEMCKSPAEPKLPEGIQIRPFDRDTELHDLIAAVRETFRDHWGHVDRDPEKELKMWRHWVFEDPDFDPSVWHLACEGDAIVGFSIGSTKRPEAENLAYIYSLGVRKAWRGRGIARALLRHVFRAFYERGRTVVDLDSDAENLTGAMRLYESVGMHAVWHEHVFEKELRPGIDLARRSLEED